MTKSNKKLITENADLKRRLKESDELLSAIRHGDIDALVISESEGEKVFTLEGADRAYRIFVEAMNEGAITLTIAGTIIYSNRRFAEMVNSNLEKVIGSSIFNFLLEFRPRHL